MMRHAVLLLATLAVAVALFLQPAIPQPLVYHQMADQRSWLGIPNAWNVLSNLPFAIVGTLGLAAVLHPRLTFHDRWERWPYVTLFEGVALTALGSGYYHLAPDNARLVWDRLPMTIGFMGLLTAVLAERVSVPVARRLFVPLLAIGAASVLYWYWSELRGAGDLRLYLLVQFGSLALVTLLLAVYPPRYPGTAYVVAGLLAYAAAKGLETVDAAILALGGIVSGHSLKHLVAAGGVACIVAMLRARRTRDVPAA